MFRIAAAEFFFNFKICSFPEASEVARELDRLEAGGQEFHQYGLAPAVDARRLPDAIFFYDDYLAAGGLIALAATGLRVPEDIHVATIANKGLGPVWFRPLTRLEYDPVGNARLIGDYVLKLLAGKTATPPALQLKFIEGKT